jgi:hypothetical protein
VARVRLRAATPSARVGRGRAQSGYRQHSVSCRSTPTSRCTRMHQFPFRGRHRSIAISRTDHHLLARMDGQRPLSAPVRDCPLRRLRFGFLLIERGGVVLSGQPQAMTTRLRKPTKAGSPSARRLITLTLLMTPSASRWWLARRSSRGAPPARSGCPWRTREARRGRPRERKCRAAVRDTVRAPAQPGRLVQRA